MPGAAEQEREQVVDPILDPLAEAVEQRRRLVQGVVTLHREDLVKLLAGLRRVRRRRGGGKCVEERVKAHLGVGEVEWAREQGLIDFRLAAEERVIARG